MTCTLNNITKTSGLVFLESSDFLTRRQHRDRFGRGHPFGNTVGNAVVSEIKFELQTIGSALRFERSTESEQARNSWDFTENYRTTDFAILQYPFASRSHILLRLLSGSRATVTVFIP